MVSDRSRHDGAPPRLVYYSLVPTIDGHSERQWVQSIRSLRRHNRSVPVHLCVYGEVPADVGTEADRHGIDIHCVEALPEYLHRLHVHGRYLSVIPTLHKILSLRLVSPDPDGQALYLDCDTFFFSDVLKIFEAHRTMDLYAREEHASPKVDDSFDFFHIDSDVIERIVSTEGLFSVAPLNSGVCLYNRNMATRILQLDVNFLDMVWRLLVGRVLASGGKALEFWGLGGEFMAVIAEVDRARALPLPTENDWILEEVAMWLTLGYLPNLSQAMFDHDYVAQSDEFEEYGLSDGWPVVAHYFTACETFFFEQVSRIHR